MTNVTLAPGNGQNRGPSRISKTILTLLSDSYFEHKEKPDVKLN